MRSLPSLVVLVSLWALGMVAKADVYADVNALVQSSQWDKAQDLAQTRLKTAPTDPQMRLLLSHIQTGQGQTLAAIETLRALTASFPELPEPHNNLAALLVRENRHEEALIALQAAIQARPDYALALENLGDLHLALAARAFAQALNASPQQSRVQSKKLATEQLLQTP
ncbi:tetratricopeptide repeat protein [Limnohabitans sp.]|jgi:tetratricopeptide (TPR) repeat protein|uniref:tetratricopeptide repeat protein n=1 Tax=Limnohabitans sp. TaxID=1907725 RepID=UPI0037BF0D0D